MKIYYIQWIDHNRKPIIEIHSSKLKADTRRKTILKLLDKPLKVWDFGHIDLTSNKTGLIAALEFGARLHETMMDYLTAGYGTTETGTTTSVDSGYSSILDRAQSEITETTLPTSPTSTDTHTPTNISDIDYLLG